MFKFLSPLVCLILLSGCSLLPKPQKPGAGTVNTPSVTAEFVQPENPAQSAKQDVKTITKSKLEIPEGTKVTEITTSTNEAGVPIKYERIFHLDQATTQESVTETEVKTSVGAAQKDTAREIGAKLAAMRPVQYVGFILILAALAMFHPVVRSVTMSSTLQMVTGAVGILLIFLPMVIVGNEVILLVAGIGIPTVWFFVHKHGKLQGLVDANKDGIDDRVQDYIDQIASAQSEAAINDLVNKASKYPGGKIAANVAADQRKSELGL
jgi:hypothetical protein